MARRAISRADLLRLRQDGVMANDIKDKRTATTDAENDAVEILRQLIRIDSTNTGEDETTVGEAQIAEHVEELLREVGYQPTRFHTTSASRQGVYLRIAGKDSERPALLLHGHLDAVAAFADEWTYPPFAAEIRDGMIWGRGAVDMKHFVAMVLAVVRHWARSDYQPPRDVVLIFTPDEEAGGRKGAHWIVDHHPEFFDGVTEAVGEVGGFSLTVREDLRLYLIQTAEKGMAWMRLRAEGTAGHGSMPGEANAVARLVGALNRIAEHRFPLVLTPTTKQFLTELLKAAGSPVDVSDPDALLEAAGPLAELLGATLSDTATPTMLNAGHKVNVIPGTAEACVDGRFLPGREKEFLAEIDELLDGDVVREFVNFDVALETSFDGPMIDAMTAALLAEDPAARAVPYMLSGGTDAKAWSRLDIRSYGFAPLRLPPDLNFAAMFHAVDERVPVDAIRFGVRVLNRFLDNV